MRILFVHNQFPGPFHHIAATLAKDPDNTVLFLSESRRREVKIPGVRNLTVPGLRAASMPEDTDAAEKEFLAILRRGSRSANAMLRLKNNGFIPDIIYASTGMGCGFYARDIFPDAFYAVHADWFYNKGENYTFFTHGKPRSPVEFAPARIRNLFQLNALTESNLAITSTQWQKKQFPEDVADQIHVQDLGVDIEFFSPDPKAVFRINGCDLSKVPELVTFSSRSLEPFRGFPQFCKSLPRLLAARPDCHVLIMIEQGQQESIARAWEVLRSIIGESSKDLERVHIHGFTPYSAYRQMLRASDVHVYLTAPFALSSGLFEAMSCGCLVVGSDTPPVQEVLKHGENGFLCDFWDDQMLADTVTTLLARKDDMDKIRKAARKAVITSHDQSKAVARHLDLMSKTYKKWKEARA